MATLFIVNQLENQDLSLSLKRLLQSDDYVLLLCDACYGAKFLTLPCQWAVLECDVLARGLALDKSVIQITHHDWVNLCVEYQKVITWS